MMLEHDSLLLDAGLEHHWIWDVELEVVSDNSDVTIAFVTVDGITATGHSKRHYKDRFHPGVGERLAVSRALRSLADDLEPEVD